MRFLKRVALTAICAGLMLALTAPAARAELTVKANHDDIKIGYDYHGSNVSVSGQSDSGVDLVLKIASADGHEKLMRKDKVGGFLWMNVEQVSIEKIPEVYYLRSTDNPDSILNQEQLSRYGIGYDALVGNAELDAAGGSGQKSSLFDEFIKYKESKSLYSESVGGIDIKPESSDSSYYTMFDWPYQAPPGEYEVTAYAIKDGNVIDTATSSVLVEQTGSVNFLSELATNNAALYGAAAILIAIGAGFGVGIIFRTGGGAH